MEGSDGIDDSSLVVRIPLATPNVQSSLTCDAVGTLPDVDSNDILVGCKKANNVNKFYSTTAGIAAIVRPSLWYCGQFHRNLHL